MSFCNASFITMGSGYGPGGQSDGSHLCELVRLHEGAHLTPQGFTWGLVNGHDDPWHQKLLAHDRKIQEKRDRARKRWYNKLAQRLRN